ncbi:hypothetical protein OHA91_21270 [Streptomyces erythrochromogenes]|uniref:Class F sortase n=1 Tax=Streptomyces erythrochromogenes TaxID=285574 RepID=A0ABZ1QDV2_9ACTN|nr:hypothetical protein [Streptomyces erythrochromogenes]MCX5586140.1 hypothetical protein [Streptomyces erythrochromogenes]
MSGVPGTPNSGSRPVQEEIHAQGAHEGRKDRGPPRGRHHRRLAVDAIDTFKKDAFPTDKVYGDTRGRPELWLITCGGNLAQDRHWGSDVVVFAHLTGEA